MISSIQRGLVYLFTLSVVFEGWNFLDLGGNSLPKMIAYVLMVFSLLNIKQSFAIVPFKRYLIPLFLFSGLLITSYIINNDSHYNNFRLILMILLNIIFFWVLVNIIINNPKMAYKVLVFLNLGIFLSTIFFLFGIGVSFEDGRLLLFGDNPNRIGLFAVFSILFVMSIVFENNQNYGRFRYLLLLMIIPMLNMAAQTGSRVTFMGLFLTVSLFFILKSEKNLPAKLFFLFIGAIVMAVVYSYFMKNNILRERLLSFYTEGDLSGRDVIWKFVLPNILEKPIIGVGTNGYTRIISGLMGGYFSPHNVLIEVFAYSGILGLLIYLGFIFRVGKESYYALKYDGFVLPILYFFLILLVFMSGQALAVKSFWVIYAYLVTCSIRRTKST